MSERKKPERPPETRHMCRVCWSMFADHKGWQLHAIRAHGADPWDYHVHTCRVEGPSKISSCPGPNAFIKKSRERGPKVKHADLGKPVIGKDGNTYTPIPLPGE